ncbi:hypothetical protein ACFL27_18765 [candidate division CSSED10-310 bacterium]|uniref:Novel STAND NTPase 1 domain-containing protein n=1 Tax=candidate division CSSED10-310 bacterium TaxID=2855610 RepID=A0ABV6Z1E5_UNCC1
MLEFEKVIPEILSHRIWVRNMSAIQVESVISNPCRICGVEIEPGISNRVITELGQDKQGIELPFVQVVMDTLYNRAKNRDPEHPTITLKDRGNIGGVRTILANFIENQIQDLPNLDKVKQVLKTLITTEGTKRVLAGPNIAELSANYGEELESSVVQAIMRDLVFRRIIREDPDQGLYELRHDILAQTIHQWMTGLEQELMEVRQTLDNRYKEFQLRSHAYRT